MENQDVKPAAVVHAAVSDDKIRMAFSIKQHVCRTITDAINADSRNGYIVTGCTYFTDAVSNDDMFIIYVSNGKEDDRVASVTIERSKSRGVWKCSGINSCGDRIHCLLGHLANELAGNDRLVRLIGNQAEIIKILER